MNEEKSKAQRANERKNTLKAMTEDEKKDFRQRKKYVGIAHEWKTFFEEMDAEAVKEIILAVIEYDETQEVPEILQNKTNVMIFKSFIKSFLDSLLDEWYLTCSAAKARSEAGVNARAINREILQRLAAQYRGETNYNGVKFERLLKDNSPGWRELIQHGSTPLEIDTLKKEIQKIREEVEREFTESE